MAKTIKITCSYCGIEFDKLLSEYNRQVKKGNNIFYCSTKCSGKGRNKNKIKPDIEKICPYCGTHFITTSKSKGATYCSRSCASKDSVNGARINAGKKAAKENFIPGSVECIVSLLKKREAWKYSDVKNFLDSINENYEFEYQINNFIYDLVLFDRGIIIEFDGPDHKHLDESSKEENAELYGYNIYRINVHQKSVINRELIYDLIQK